MRLCRATLILLLVVVAVPALAEWQRVAEGIDYRRIVRDSIDVHVARIDLSSDALRVIATRERHRGLTVSEFARATGAIVAINADYFDEQLRPIGLSMDDCGVWWEGVQISRKQGLVAAGAGRAEIQRNEMRTEEWMTAAVSGWPLVVESCRAIEDLPGSDHFTRAPHPRTAAGLSKDGKTIYFVVADGRRESVPGMTLPELAEFLVSELEICVAMNLDGGGSTAMWVRDAIVNVPSDGAERKVGNHLGVVAAESYEGCVRTRVAKE